MVAIVAGIEAAQWGVNEGGVVSAVSYAPAKMPSGHTGERPTFLLFGKTMGAQALGRAPFPLPAGERLSGTSIKVTVAGVSAHASMIYALEGQLATMLRADVATRNTTLTVADNKHTSATACSRLSMILDEPAGTCGNAGLCPSSNCFSRPAVWNDLKGSPGPVRPTVWKPSRQTDWSQCQRSGRWELRQWCPVQPGSAR
jgi:hypothetical protein